MSNVFTLASLREEVEKKYAPVEIGLADGSTVELRNLLRLGDTERKETLALIDSIKGSDGKDATELETGEISDLIETIGKILPIVATSTARGTKLVKEIGDDLALVMEVFGAWMGNSQPGEAESSPA